MNTLTVALPHAIADIPSVSWQEAIEPFLNTLDSPQTRRSYCGDIAEAMQRLKIKLISEIMAPMLTEYRARLVARLDARGARRLASSTVARKLAAVRSFLRFCRLTGLTRLTSEVIAFALKSPTATVVKPYEVLTPTEQARMLKVLNDHPRDRVLVALALGAGLRASELTGVKVSDILSDDDGADWVVVRTGKGHKDRLVPLAPEVTAMLHEYIAAHKLRRDGYLITSRQGESGRMTSARVWQIVTGAVKSARINKRLSPHSLRHSYGRSYGRLVNAS